MSRNFRMPRGSDGAPLSPFGAAAALAIVATLVLCTFILVPFVTAKHGDQPAAASSPAKNDPGAFQSEIARRLAQVSGRSLFAIPGPPSDRGDHGPRPAAYSGPPLLYIVNDTAVFGDGERVSLAQPNGKTVRLVSLRPPWSARVEWDGGEFDVELFKRVPIASLRDSLGKPIPPSAPDSGGAPDKPKPAARGPGPTAPLSAAPATDDHESDAESEGDKEPESTAPAPPAPKPSFPPKPAPKPETPPHGMSPARSTPPEHE